MAERGRWGDKIIVVLHAKDDRRHRRWCEYYRESDGLCYKSCAKCGGSAHCKHYKPTKRPHEEIPVPTPPKPDNVKKLTKESFDGIQLIDMKDIILPLKHMQPPSPEKVAALRKFYQENGVLDKPIVVSCHGNKYMLEDKYLRYYVAKQLGLPKIHAKIGTKKNKPEDYIRKKGSKLIHKSYGEVTVVSSTMMHTVVRDSEGKLITLDIETCLKNNLLQVIF